MTSLNRLFWIAFYSVFAKRLPHSYAIAGGSLGKYLRAACARRLFASCGKDVNIEKGATFGSGRKITLGDCSDLGVNCRVYGELHIGNNSFMGPDVVIWTTNHRFDRTDIPMMYQGNGVQKPVHIGDDVWIGTRVILLAGVHIGNHAVVGAGAVVAKNVPDWAIVAGNPACIVRYRNAQEQSPASSEPTRRQDVAERHLPVF